MFKAPKCLFFHYRQTLIRYFCLEMLWQYFCSVNFFLRDIFIYFFLFWTIYQYIFNFLTDSPLVTLARIITYIKFIKNTHHLQTKREIRI